MFSTNRFFRVVLIFLTAIAFVVLSLGASAAPPAGALDETHASVRAVMAVQSEVTSDLLRQAEILGTAVGLDTAGTPVLTVYIDRDSANAGEVIRNLPHSVREVAVQIHLTDKFRALKRKPRPTPTPTPNPTPTPTATPTPTPTPSPAASHTARQTPPIYLGTSGGWSKDLANGYCCGGTLGSLVSIGGVQHILSNYHVFESDIVNGGNNTTAQTGDPIIQPGLIDVNCNKNNAQTVGTLVKKSSLPGSNVDCSIAQVVPGMVRTDGAILEIGTISHLTASAAINQAVKKSGRTTGLSRSSVSGLNATISVTYDNECAGGTAFTKTFTGQIVITNSGSRFLNSGDSGSLMVEDIATNPRAVGLLYAGSSTSAIANPIGQVLSFLGATMVGN